MNKLETVDQESDLLELENENETTEEDLVDSSEGTLSEDELYERIQGNGRQTKEVVITRLEEGQYFGAYSLLNEDEPRPVSVFAAKALEVIEINQAAYRLMLRFHQ